MLKKAVLCLSIIVLSSTGTLASGRPHGCPHRYCGCALSIKVFGKSVRDLWLASNWFRFPRTAPSPNMVAVRRGHVFQLLSHVKGSTWQVWDPNSGRGQTRIHNRSIAGLTIVNPRGGHGSSMSVRETHRSQDQVTVWQGHNQKAAGRRSRPMPEVLASVSRQTEN